MTDNLSPRAGASSGGRIDPCATTPSLIAALGLAVVAWLASGIFVVERQQRIVIRAARSSGTVWSQGCTSASQA
jgi:hypothetical protein